MSKAVENQLDYVRGRVGEIPKGQMQSTALAAGVPLRTLYNLKRDDFDPRYSTVRKLCEYLRKTEPKRRAARAK
jgi:predicted transcriptional regulator